MTIFADQIKVSVMFVDVYEGFFAIDTNVIGIDFAGIQIIEK